MVSFYQPQFGKWLIKYEFVYLCMGMACLSTVTCPVLFGAQLYFCISYSVQASAGRMPPQAVRNSYYL